MKDVARQMGVRTDVPFRDLTEKEKDIVFHGPAEKQHFLYTNEKTNVAAEMDFTYFNAIYTVENALAKAKDEKGANSGKTDRSFRSSGTLNPFETEQCFSPEPPVPGGWGCAPAA